MVSDTGDCVWTHRYGVTEGAVVVPIHLSPMSDSFQAADNRASFWMMRSDRNATLAAIGWSLFFLTLAALIWSVM